MEMAIDPSPHDILQASQRSNTRTTTIHDRSDASVVLRSDAIVHSRRSESYMLTLITYTEVVNTATYPSQGSKGSIGQLPRPMAV